MPAVEHRRRRHRHRQRHGGIGNHGKNLNSGKNDNKKNGKISNGGRSCEYSRSGPLLLLQESGTFVVKKDFACRQQRMSCTRREWRPNTSPDAAHPHIFLVARRVAQLSHISRFIPCTCLGSRLDESSQHVCRVLKTVHLLHSHSSTSCLVATPCASLSVVLLFLTDWRRNRGSPASIPAAVAGLAEWLNSPRSQVVSPRT